MNAWSRVLILVGVVAVIAVGGGPREALAVSAEARREYKRAADLKEDERFREALEAYEAVLKLEPEYAEALHDVGLIHLERNRPKEALPYLERAARVADDNPAILIDFAKAAELTGAHQKAVAPLQKVLAKDANNTEALGLLGPVLMELGNLSEAAQILIRHRTAEPEKVLVFAHLGEVFRRRGELEKAKEFFSLAITKDRTATGVFKLTEDQKAMVHIGLADIAIREQRFDEAEVDIELAKKLAPNSKEIAELTTRMQVAQGNPEAAAGNLEAAYKRNPNDPKVTWDLAQVYTVAGRHEEAIDLFEKLLNKGYRSNDAVYQEIAQVQERAGDAEAALETLKPLLKSKSPDADLLRDMIRLAEDAGRLSDAVGYLKLYVKTNEGKTVTGYLQLARMHSKRQDYEGAVDALQDGLKVFKNNSSLIDRMLTYAAASGDAELEADAMALAAKAGPEDYATKHRMGIALLEQNKPGEAVKHFEALARAYPKRADSYIGLAYALQESKSYQDALDAFKRAKELDPRNERANAGIQQLEKVVAAQGSGPSRPQIEALLAQKQYNRALNALQGYLEENPGDAWARQTMASTQRTVRQLNAQRLREIEQKELQTEIAGMKKEVINLVAKEDYVTAFIVIEKLADIAPQDQWVSEQHATISDHLNSQLSAQLGDDSGGGDMVARVSTRGGGGQSAPAGQAPLFTVGNVPVSSSTMLVLGMVLFGTMGGGFFFFRKQPATIDPVDPDSRDLATDSGVLSSGRRTFRGMAGQLDEMNIGNLVQYLHNEEKTGILYVNCDGQEGQVYYVDGDIHDAEYDESTGMDAMFKILDLTHGDFEFEVAAVDLAKRIKTSVPNILLQFVCAKDEAERDAVSAEDDDSFDGLEI